MIKHEMKITVRNSSGQSLDIAEFKKLSLFKRLSTKWFGKAQKVMVIVPGDSVQSVEIKEVEVKDGKQQNARKSRAI